MKYPQYVPNMDMIVKPVFKLYYKGARNPLTPDIVSCHTIELDINKTLAFQITRGRYKKTVYGLNALLIIWNFMEVSIENKEKHNKPFKSETEAIRYIKKVRFELGKKHG